MPSPVVICEYNDQWPREAMAVRDAVAGALGSLAERIEHVGSTAVPGLAAKPILDLDIVLAVGADMPGVVGVLHTLGYEHDGDLGIAGREAFSRIDREVPWTATRREWMEHHLYACERDSEELARHLAFRDYLRCHATAAQSYAALKYELAVRFGDDRESYCRAKTDFIEEVLRKATGHPG